MAAVKMRDVASHAGVSVSTVSKVLSGKATASRFPPQTIERIHQAALHLGYIPNAVARNLRVQRTHEIGIVLGMETYPDAASLTLDGAFLLSLINIVGSSHLPGVVIYPREQNSTISDISRYLDGRIDGLLVRASTPHQEEQLLSLLAHSSLPVVAIWSQNVPETIGYIDIDHRAGAYQAVHYLITLGHQRIAYIEPEPVFAHPHFIARHEGYLQALRDAQITPQPEWHVIGAKAEQLAPLLRLPEPITAAFTPNDITAGEVATTFQSLQIRIPTDISLIGFDDIASANLIAGGLTTIHHPLQEMAVHAVKNLTALIAGAPVAHCRTLLPTHLVLRESCAPPRC